MDMVERPYALGKKRIGQGMGQVSYISSVLENNDVKPGSEEDFVLKWSAASVYAGGSDTVRIVSIRSSFCTSVFRFILTKGETRPYLR